MFICIWVYVYIYIYICIYASTYHYSFQYIPRNYYICLAIPKHYYLFLHSLTYSQVFSKYSYMCLHIPIFLPLWVLLPLLVLAFPVPGCVRQKVRALRLCVHPAGGGGLALFRGAVPVPGNKWDSG